jgi:hypothetical protein
MEINPLCSSAVSKLNQLGASCKNIGRRSTLGGGGGEALNVAVLRSDKWGRI